MTYRWLKRLSGAKDPEKGARALVWGMSITLLLKFLADMFMFNIVFPEIEGPALNTSTPVLLGDLITIFSAQVFGSFVAAFLARSLPLRHALLAGIPVYIGSIIGTFVQWNAVPLWRFPVQGLVALAGAGTSGLLAGQFSANHDASES